MRTILFLFLLFLGPIVYAQTVETLAEDFSGGSITFDQEGNLLISDILGTATNWININGSRIRQLNLDGSSEDYLTGLSLPVGKVHDSEGNFYVAENGTNKITKHDTQGNSVTLAAGFSSPTGLAIDAANNLYVANFYSHSFHRVSPEGVKTFIANDPIFYGTNGIIFGPDSLLYCSNWLSGRIIRMDKAGNFEEFAQLPLGSDPNFAGSGFVTYANNHFYASGLSSNRLYKIDMDGNVSVLAGTGTAGYLDGPATEAQFAQPNGIQASYTGDTLFVTETVARRVRMVLLDNSTSSHPTIQSFETLEINPNPTNHQIRINFKLSLTSAVEVQLLDNNGREIATIQTAQEMVAGLHSLEWVRPPQLSPGTYYVWLRTQDSNQLVPIIIK